MTYQGFYLSHAGKKGMKWGYNDGRRNGNQVAQGPKDQDPKERLRLESQQRDNDRRAQNSYRTNQQNEAKKQINKGLNSLTSGVKKYAKNEAGRYYDSARSAARKVNEYGKERDRRSAIERSERSRKTESVLRSEADSIKRGVSKGIDVTKKTASAAKKYSVSAAKKSNEYAKSQDSSRSQSRKQQAAKASSARQNEKKQIKSAASNAVKTGVSAAKNIRNFANERDRQTHRQTVDQINRAYESRENEKKAIKKTAKKTKTTIKNTSSRIKKKGKKRLARVLRNAASSLDD